MYLIYNGENKQTEIDAFFGYYENQYIVTWRVGTTSHVSEPMLREEAGKLRNVLLASQNALEVTLAKVILD